MNRIIPAGCLAALFLAGCNSLLSILLFRVTTVLPLMWRLPGTLSTHYGTKVYFPANFRFQRGLIF